MLGGVVTVLASLAVVIALLALLGATAFAGAGLPHIALLLVRGAGAALAAYGGYQMYQYEPAGKNRVIYGFVVFAAAEVFLFFFSPFSEFLALVVTGVLYYLVVTSHFPVQTTTTEPSAS
jgi:hypothetical protein